MIGRLRSGMQRLKDPAHLVRGLMIRAGRLLLSAGGGAGVTQDVAPKGLRVELVGSGRPAVSGYLAATIVMKDEARYLEEWLEFHLMVGVEHIFVYDNASTDGSWELLDRFVASGSVTRIPWDSPHLLHEPVRNARTQRLAYWHALSNFGRDWRWMTMIDTDEFILPGHGDDLRTLLEDYEDLAGLALFWKMFGTSGHDRPPDGLVLENYVHRTRFPAGTYTKTIIDPRSVSSIGGVHDIGDRLFDEERRPLAGIDLAGLGSFERGGPPRPYTPPSERFLFHHYYMRSASEFRQKVERARRYGKPKVTSDLEAAGALIEADPVRDDAALRFVPHLKERLLRAN